MRATFTRELVVIARQPALAAASTLIAVVLVAFTLMWPRGVPEIAGLNAYEQTRDLAIVLCAVVLPWIGVRVASPERADALVMLSAFLGVRTSSLIASKAMVHSAVLAAVMFTVFPALVNAQQAAAVPLSIAAVDACALTGIALLAAAVATTCSLVVPGRLSAWLAATIVTDIVLLLIWRLAPALPFVGAMSALIGVGVTCATAAWGNATLFHLQDRHA